MLEFIAHDFCKAIELLDGLISDYRSDKAKRDTLTDHGAQYALNIIDHVSERCANVQLTSVPEFVDRIRHQINAGEMGHLVFDECRAIRTLIYQELEQRKFAYIQYRKSELLDGFERDWATIFDRFGSVRKDARATTEAYAFELNNACVFHSMMVLEKGLTALARAVRVDTRRDTWGRIIGRIETAISGNLAAVNNPPPGTKPLSRRAADARRTRFDTYAEAAKEFTYFRVAWRNHVSHGHADYDESVALRVLSHVRDFMSCISAHLKERRGVHSP